MPNKKKSKSNDQQESHVQPIRKSLRTTKGQPPPHFHDYFLNQTPFCENQLSPTSTPVPSLNLSKESSTASDESTVIQRDNGILQMMQSMSKQMSEMKIDVLNTIHKNRQEMDERFLYMQEQLNESKTNIHSNENVAVPQVIIPNNVPDRNIPHVNLPVNVSHSMMNHGAEMRYDVRRKLHDLPIFNGSPKEWPMFITSYKESSAAFAYTNLENSIRLQKSVQGTARHTVEAMLIYPENVDEVIKELEFRFGRPELLVKSQIVKVQSLPSIREDDLTQLIRFSTQVRNLEGFLRSAKAEQHLQNPSLVEELVSKLPMQRRMEWAEHLMKLDKVVSVADFSAWLSHVARIASLVEPTMKFSSSSSVPTTKPSVNIATNKPSNKKFTLHANEVRESEEVLKCNYCCQNHKITQCKAFANLSIDQKWKWVKEENVCFCCLLRGHRINNCRKRKKCGVADCKFSHHQLLHEVKVPNRPPPAQVFFRIVPVTLFGEDDVKVETFAMLDEGSSTSMMESNLAKQLKLKGKPDQISIQWFDDPIATKQTLVVNCGIQGQSEGCKILQLKNVQAIDSLNLPCQTMNRHLLVEKYPQLKMVPLNEYFNVKPRLLIGLDNARMGYAMEWVDCPPSGPIAVRTPLGWLLYGPQNTETLSNKNNRILFVHSAYQDELQKKYAELDEVVNSFYEMEKFGVEAPSVEVDSHDDEKARRILKNTTVFVNDHYESGLLWKSKNINMPDSYPMALRRLENLENKMCRDAEYSESYKKAVNEFVEKGYARKLSHEKAQVVSQRTWYLPHFGVVNPNKIGKVRLVFDAAASINGVSLNSQLLKGPDINQSMMTVLSQFREGPIAVCGDIKEMFCQVKIRPDDQDSQRFLWRNGEVDKRVEVYQMQSMIFGATCSPTTAQYVKNVNAERFRSLHPEAVNAIIQNHYVDDFVISFVDEETAIRVSKAVKLIQSTAGFDLTRFTSNSQTVKDALSDEASMSSHVLDMDVNPGLATEKVLGMFWNSEADIFVFEFRMHKVQRDIAKT